MSTAIEITLFIALVLSIILPGVAFLKGERTKGRFKSHLAVNCFTFFGLLGVTVVSTFAGASNVLAASASSGRGAQPSARRQEPAPQARKGRSRA